MCQAILAGLQLAHQELQQAWSVRVLALLTKQRQARRRWWRVTEARVEQAASLQITTFPSGSQSAQWQSVSQ